MKNLGLLLFLVVAILFMMGRNAPEMQQAQQPAIEKVQSSPKPDPKTAIDKSPQMQKDREEFIQRMIGEGMFLKVDAPAILPHAYVTSRFLYQADVDTKKSILGVVYCWYFDSLEISQSVVIRDALTGERLGSYSPNLGLVLNTK